MIDINFISSMFAPSGASYHAKPKLPKTEKAWTFGVEWLDLLKHDADGFPIYQQETRKGAGWTNTAKLKDIVMLRVPAEKLSWNSWGPARERCSENIQRTKSRWIAEKPTRSRLETSTSVSAVRAQRKLQLRFASIWWRIQQRTCCSFGRHG